MLKQQHSQLTSVLLPDLLAQTKPRWTAVPGRRTQSSTTSWSSCSPATDRWRSASPAPSASTTTSSWCFSADTPPASSAAPRSRPAPSAGRPFASASSCSCEPPSSAGHRLTEGPAPDTHSSTLCYISNTRTRPLSLM